MAYSHVRLRKFNTAKTYPEQKLDNDLSMSVRAGNFVFLRGQVGQALDGSNVGTGDAAAQTEQAMRT
jgi:enamine deaminase RidA (YjgF/YER057c/UK114 family)